jgi:hypothetical protein
MGSEIELEDSDSESLSLGAEVEDSDVEFEPEWQWLSPGKKVLFVSARSSSTLHWSSAFVTSFGPAWEGGAGMVHNSFANWRLQLYVYESDQTMDFLIAEDATLLSVQETTVRPFGLLEPPSAPSPSPQSMTRV